MTPRADTPEPKRASLLDLRAVVANLLRRSRDQGAWVTTGWVFSSYGLGTLFYIALQVVQAHQLSLAEFGFLGAAIALAQLFEQTVMTRGAETALSLFARKAHEDPGPWGSLTLELILIDLIWLIVCAGLYLAAVFAWAPVRIDRGLLALLALGTVLQFAWGTCKSAQIVFEPVRRQSQLEALVSVATFLLPAAGILLDGMHGFGWGMAALGALRSAAALVFVWPRLKGARWPTWSGRLIRGRELRNLGTLAIMRSSAANLSSQLDMLLLPLSGMGLALAHYRAARIVSAAPGRVFQPIWTLARKAVVTGIHRGGIREARSQITLAALAMLILGLPAFLVAWFFGRALLAFVFTKPEYADGAVALAILLPSSWFYDVMTGWAKFAAAVAPKKLVTTGAFVARCVLCYGLWLAWRPTDATGMAWILAITNVVIGSVFWLALFNDRWLIGADRSAPPPLTPLDDPEPG
jgi:O-antigen/teichoic acid export membrane protein